MNGLCSYLPALPDWRSKCAKAFSGRSPKEDEAIDDLPCIGSTQLFLSHATIMLVEAAGVGVTALLLLAPTLAPDSHCVESFNIGMPGAAAAGCTLVLLAGGYYFGSYVRATRESIAIGDLDDGYAEGPPIMAQLDGNQLSFTVDNQQFQADFDLLLSNRLTECQPMKQRPGSRPSASSNLLDDEAIDMGAGVGTKNEGSPLLEDSDSDEKEYSTPIRYFCYLSDSRNLFFYQGTGGNNEFKESGNGYRIVLSSFLQNQVQNRAPLNISTEATRATEAKSPSIPPGILQCYIKNSTLYFTLDENKWKIRITDIPKYTNADAMQSLDSYPADGSKRNPAPTRYNASEQINTTLSLPAYCCWSNGEIFFTVLSKGEWKLNIADIPEQEVQRVNSTQFPEFDEVTVSTKKLSPILVTPEPSEEEILL